MTAPVTDLHRLTVYHDERFHAYMDQMAQFPELGISRNWRSWKFRRVRMYAKRWSWGALYGVPAHVIRDAWESDTKEK